MDSKNIPLSNLVSELRELCQEKCTGNFYILAANTGQMMQFSLRQGDIVYIFAEGKRGEHALALASTFGSGHSRFISGSIHSKNKTHQISTAEILSLLDSTIRQAPKTVHQPKAMPALAMPPMKSSSHAPLPDAIRTILEEELTELVGPFALIVCSEKLSQAYNIETAITLLRRELSGAQASEFEKNVRRRIGFS